MPPTPPPAPTSSLLADVPRTGVLATLAGLLVLVALLALVPGVRGAAASSLSRQDAPYLELAAAPLGDQELGTTCRRAGRTPVAFTVRNPSARPVTAEWSVLVAQGPVDRLGSVTRRVTGDLVVAPGETGAVMRRVPVPGAAYDLHVVLRGTDLRLLLHCGASS